jgi:lysophospholipid acyltransferase (LPLAT)-like uncharacterized protein
MSVFEWILKWILFLVIRFLYWTYRFEIIDESAHVQAKNLHPLHSYLVAFWHEHLLSPLLFFASRKVSLCGLISDSSDGKMIAFQCRKFGHAVIHGSQIRDGKDKGGLRALIGLLGELKKGNPIAITVDGSIGPRRYVKAGIVELARKSNAPILPFGCAASRYWTLNTWDQFKIPKPFAHIVIQLGTPLSIPRDLSKEEIPQYQEQIAKSLNKQEKEAIKYLHSRLAKLQK